MANLYKSQLEMLGRIKKSSRPSDLELFVTQKKSGVIFRHNEFVIDPEDWNE